MRWILVGCVAAVVFDAVSAVAAKALNFEYGGLPGVLVSTAIYAFPAFMLVRNGRRLRMAALAGAAVALADATVGWAVSWVIGPGAVPPDSSSPEVLALIVIMVAGLGALIGLAAGIVAVLIARKQSPVE